jgi:hypothetical protein
MYAATSSSRLRAIRDSRRLWLIAQNLPRRLEMFARRDEKVERLGSFLVYEHLLPEILLVRPATEARSLAVGYSVYTSFQ